MFRTIGGEEGKDVRRCVSIVGKRFSPSDHMSVTGRRSHFAQLLIIIFYIDFCVHVVYILLQGKECIHMRFLPLTYH